MKTIVKTRALPLSNKDDRSEFDTIFNFIIEQKEKIAICCDKVDRLSRNMFDKRVSFLYDKALRDEIELHFTSDGQIINSKISAAEKFHFGISLGLAKYYSDHLPDMFRNGEVAITVSLTTIQTLYSSFKIKPEIY